MNETEQRQKRRVQLVMAIGRLLHGHRRRIKAGRGDVEAAEGPATATMVAIERGSREDVKLSSLLSAVDALNELRPDRAPRLRLCDLLDAAEYFSAKHAVLREELKQRFGGLDERASFDLFFADADPTQMIEVRSSAEYAEWLKGSSG